jgi:hypothetical protein
MGRYQFLSRRSLPRFGGGTEATKVVRPAEKSAQPVSDNGGDVSRRRPRPFQSRPVKSMASVAPGNAPIPAASAGVSGRHGVGMRVTTWLRAVCARFSGRANPFNAGMARPETGGELEKQPLLRLNTVHVVRNDLSDSDFEVVKTRRRAAAGNAAAVSGTGAEPALKLEFKGSSGSGQSGKGQAMVRSGGRGA